MAEESLCEIVRKAEDNFLNGSTTLGKYVSWSMHDTLETIDAYVNSKHISGEKDSLGREKPFFNIVTAATNIWYRATDIDRKDIRIMPDKIGNTATAFIASVILQQWMKDSRFGVFLNQWGRTLAKYGSAVVKFVEKDGELHASVIPWNRLIVDPIDFNAIPRIEKFYKTEQQLYQMAEKNGYDKEQIDALCEAVNTRKTLDKQQKDNQSDFIELYEVHGELSQAVYKKSKGEKVKEGDDGIYFQQMHVISFVKNKETDTYDDFTLFSGKEKKDPYMITHLIEEDGRTLAIGAVEHLFNAQWMVNHTVKNTKDTLDLASKLIFQTADTNYVGRNVLSAIESGDIMIHKENLPLTQINNSKADITALQNFGSQWQVLAKEITSTPDALAGNTLPSGTPYSLGAYLGGQAGSLFEIMTENKGLAIEDMMRQHIIPHIKTKLNTKEEIVAILDDSAITEIDSMYIPKEAVRRFNEQAKEEILSGNIPSPFMQVEAEQAVKQDLAKLGNKRAFAPDQIGEKTWKEALKDLEMTATVEVTNENNDKKAVLQTLGTVLQVIGTNPAVLQDPNARMVFNAILTETGRISPLQLSTASAQPAPVAPALNSAGGGGLSDLVPK